MAKCSNRVRVSRVRLIGSVGLGLGIRIGLRLYAGLSATQVAC